VRCRTDDIRGEAVDPALDLQLVVAQGEREAGGRLGQVLPCEGQRYEVGFALVEVLSWRAGRVRIGDRHL
jgi:hypothetical protein